MSAVLFVVMVSKNHRLRHAFDIFDGLSLDKKAALFDRCEMANLWVWLEYLPPSS